MKKIFVFSAFLLFITNMTTMANNIPPVAIMSVTPDRDWFYNLEEVVFDWYDSYDPDDNYKSGSEWYIDGVLIQSNTPTFEVCFALYGSPSNGCRQLADGQTTVTIEMGIKDIQGDWDYASDTYTIQEHKGRNYFVTDHLGSVRATVNRDGNVLGYSDYYPFGLEMRSNNTANPNDNYKFTGHERDEEAFSVGIDYMNARTYDPVVGRFMQVDPQFDHPMQVGLSPYNYAWNNPVNLADPTGENPWPWLLRTASRTTAGRVAITESGKVLAAGGATIGTAIGFTAAYLTIDGVREGGFLNQLGEHIQENVEGAVETVENLLSEDASASDLSENKREGASASERHGDGNRAKSKAEEQIENYKAQLKDATGRAKKKIQQKIKNVRRDAERKAKGEEHSRTKKGN